MADGKGSASIGMQDVRLSFMAVEDDLPVRARIVVWLHERPNGERVVAIAGQACDSVGQPLSHVSGERIQWPDRRFRTVTAAMHWCLERVYGQVEYQLAMIEAESEQRG
jgi:hypothetical protein